MTDTRDDQRQTCKACGRLTKFDFDVPDDVWAAVVPADLRNRVLYLYCFDAFASDVSVRYADKLRALYFAGDAASFEFQVTSAVDVAR